jgi:hypothetical protein
MAKSTMLAYAGKVDDGNADALYCERKDARFGFIHIRYTEAPCRGRAASHDPIGIFTLLYKDFLPPAYGYTVHAMNTAINIGWILAVVYSTHTGIKDDGSQQLST